MTFLFTLAAFFYALAGHGGASAYLPLGLASGLSAPEARSVALILNLVVAGIAALSFASAGFLRPKVLLPLLLGSLPCAYLGSKLLIHSPWMHYGLGLAMLWAAWRFSFGGSSQEEGLADTPRAEILILWGAALGALAGLTGIGGGIYLSSLLLFKRWTTVKEAAALAACFIWANSAVSLLATGVAVQPKPEWIAACGVAGLAGAMLGARKFSPLFLRRALAGVLIVAAYKALIR